MKKSTAWPKIQKESERSWYLVDASNLTLGKLAVIITTLLRGKNKVEFLPDVDCGSNVVVINLEKIKFSGKKMEQKSYFSFSGYPGGITEKKLKEMWISNPAWVVKKTLWNMMPKNRLRNRQIKRLYLFSNEKHNFSDKNLIEYKG